MMRRVWKIAGRILAVVAVIGGALFLYGSSEARSDPVVRRVTLPMADWPAGAPPVRALLVSDVHLGNAAMDAGRLARIVGRIDTLRPDIILLAGDFIAGHDAATAHAVAADLAAGLSRLRAPLGVVAVLGNHDHWSDAATVKRALTAANVTLLTNTAIRRGPLAIGGVDDQVTRHDDLPATIAAFRRLDGARILLAHTPEVIRKLRSTATSDRIPPIAGLVLLAGHTHCGQITLPLIGPVATIVDRQGYYRCGATPRGMDRIVVTAGLGTSVIPMRIGAPPDLWLITFGPSGTISPRQAPASDRDRAGG